MAHAHACILSTWLFKGTATHRAEFLVPQSGKVYEGVFLTGVQPPPALHAGVLHTVFVARQCKALAPQNQSWTFEERQMLITQSKENGCEAFK